MIMWRNVICLVLRICGCRHAELMIMNKLLLLDRCLLRGECVPRRPPVNFQRFYQDSVSFAQDCFVVETHEHSVCLSIVLVDNFSFQERN